MVQFPKLGEHLHVHIEDAPGSTDRKVICFTSKNRQIRVDGKHGRALFEIVLPLLKGTLSVNQIADRAAGAFPPEIIHEFVGLLQQSHLVYNTKKKRTANNLNVRYHPFASFFQEINMDPLYAIEALRRSVVAIFGLRGAGAFAAMSLAAAGVGHLRLLDRSLIDPGSSSTAPFFSMRDCGKRREDAMRAKIVSTYPDVAVLGCKAFDLSSDFNSGGY